MAIVGLTGGADLHVLALDCTLGKIPQVNGVPQDCGVNGRSALYLSVTSGAVNRDGAADEVLVE